MESCGCLSSIANSLCGTKSVHRARYSEQEYTIEFENLIEEDDFYEPSQHNIVSDVEKDLLQKGKFTELLAHQEMIGQQQEDMLRQQEEDARLEDEAYIEAKKEAVRARRLKKPLDKDTLMKIRLNNTREFSQWLAEEKIDITSPNLDIEDFDAFLEKVKAKSAKNKAHSLNTDDEFEKSLQHSVQATIIAGDALNALQPVELHAVSIPDNSDSVIENQFMSEHHTTAVSQYDRPFTPEFSSITSGGSSITNTPLKDDTREHESSVDISSIMTDSSFSSAVTTQSLDTEATPTNKNDTTFSISDKTPTTLNGSIFTTNAVTPAAAANSVNTPSTMTSKSTPALAKQSTPQHATNGSSSHLTADNTTTSPPSIIKTPSFKMFGGKNNTDSSSTNKTPSREFNGSAFMQDCGDSLSDDDDDFGDFDTADGGFEELLT